MSKSNPSSAAELANIQPTVSGAVATEILHNFRIDYDLGEGLRVLGPGELLPVYDLELWSMIHTFQATAHNAVRFGTKIVTMAGDDSPDEETLVMLALKSGSPLDPDLEKMITRMERLRLGNLGGTRIVRPDRLPLGVLPGELRSSNALPTLEFNPMSALDWALATTDATNQAMLPTVAGAPRLGWYIECSTGGYEGLDVTDTMVTTVIPIPLPFSWSSLQELGKVDRRDEAAEDQLYREMNYLSAFSARLRKVAAVQGWVGKVYFGYDLPLAGEFDNMCAPCSADVLHVLPYHHSNPMAILNNDAMQSAGELREGSIWGRPEPRVERVARMRAHTGSMRTPVTV